MKPLACWFGRHKWADRVTRDMDVLTVLCTCTECGKWWTSSCISTYGGDYEAVSEVRWNVAGVKAAAIYGRARALGTIVDLRAKQEPKA